MDCKYLNSCGSCVLELSYDEQKELKIAKIKELFDRFYSGEIEFFESSEVRFRSRAEFGIWHENGDISYSMRGRNSKKIEIDSCQIVDLKISNLMSKLFLLFNDKWLLNLKIFQQNYSGQ